MSAPAVARRVVGSLGLFPAAFHAYRWIQDIRPSVVARSRRARRRGAPDGLPIPPAGLIYSVVATRNVEWFLESGTIATTAIRGALAGIGRPIESFRSLLDFGCGCGRVLRHWHGIPGLALHGSDYNPSGPAWVRANIAGVDARVNQLAPPLPFADGAFDIAYALSVFTHLPESLQRPWMEELRRVVRPGGVLILSLHGDHFAAGLTEADRARYDAGELVVLQPEHAGTNLCATLHPPAHVREQLAEGFALRAHLPAAVRQDLYVLERL
jgi:SAM-dependent methyltransferase